jgi:HEAT repeat protein
MRVTREAWVLVSLLAAAAISGAACNSKDSEPSRVESNRSDHNAADHNAVDHNVADQARDVVANKADASVAEIQALGIRGPESIPRIQESLKNDRPAVRVAAALAYGQAVQVRSQAVPPAEQTRPLAEAARTDPSPDVRAAALTALAHARALDEMPTILKALEDPDPMVRARASAAVARITGRRYETYVDGTPEQRHAAAAAIRRMWAADERSTRDYYTRKYSPKGAPKP